MKVRINILIIFFYLILPLQINAQSNCDNELSRSKELYEDGDFKNVIKILEKILKDCDFNRTQENEVLKLMASAYYEMDELEIGNEYVEKFLRKNPFYIASKIILNSPVVDNLRAHDVTAYHILCITQRKSPHYYT